MYKIYAIIGKSASGKDTLAQELIKKNDMFHGVVSSTTRPKRDYEINKKDYFFLTEEEMVKNINEDKMLEISVFNNWIYGTSIDALDEDKVNIGVFNIDGINSLMEREDIDLRVFYVQADDAKRLIRQLSREKEPNIKEIFRRYDTDDKDFKDYNISFNYVTLENNTSEDFENCIATVLAFLESDYLD